MEKFSWGGNGATLTRLRRSKLLVPTNSKSEPDYEFMETFMKHKEQEKRNEYGNYLNKRLEKLKDYKKVEPIVEKEWKAFLIGDIFNIKTGALLPKQILKKGSVARITATDSNNGIFDYYHEIEHKNHRTIKNFISVSFLGSVFYHPYEASLDMKVHSVQFKTIKFNQYLAYFIVLALKRTTSLFSYGDQLSSSDLPKKQILLPINQKGEPDYNYMENYMKRLEYKKLNDYSIKNLKDYEL